MVKHEYKKEFGSYYFYVDGRMQMMADNIAICFSILDGNGVLHKHGNVDHVEEWWRNHRDEYQPLFGTLAVVDSNKWDPEVLTKCIENGSYLLELLRSVNHPLLEDQGGR